MDNNTSHNNKNNKDKSNKNIVKIKNELNTGKNKELSLSTKTSPTNGEGSGTKPIIKNMLPIATKSTNNTSCSRNTSSSSVTKNDGFPPLKKPFDINEPVNFNAKKVQIVPKPVLDNTSETEFLFLQPRQSISMMTKSFDTIVKMCCLMIDSILIMNLVCGEDRPNITNKSIWDLLSLLAPRKPFTFNVIEPELE